MPWGQEITRINVPVNMSEEGAAEIREMPCYPDNGCIKEVEGTIIIHLGNDF